MAGSDPARMTPSGTGFEATGEGAGGGSQWVSVKEARAILGVHEATLRRWTDQGLIQAFRTPGGHRRYLRSQLEAFLARGQAQQAPSGLDRLATRTLSETRRSLRARLTTQPWLPRYRHRQQDLRASGRELLGLLIQYAAREHAQEAILESARATLRRYGREAAELGLSVPETARAFLVFRQAIIDAIARGLEHPPGPDPDGWRVLRRAGRFFDELLVATLEGYLEGAASSTGAAALRPSPEGPAAAGGGQV